MVRLRTRQTSSFVYMFDSLGEIVTEAVMCFRKEGLYLRETAFSMSVLVTAQLDAHRFEEYVVDDANTVCVLVSLPLLCGLLRTANITDTLLLSVDSHGVNGDDSATAMRMEIVLQGDAGGADRTYCLPVHRIQMADPRYQDRLTPGVEKEFDHVLHLNTKHLTHMCTNVFPFASVVVIEVNGARVSFTVQSTESLVSRARVTLGGRSRGTSDASLMTEHRGQKRALTTAASASVAAKALALHPVCNMYLAEDYPLVIEILINQLGKMRLCLMHLTKEDQ
jgi:hypothetical protein